MGYQPSKQATGLQANTALQKASPRAVLVSSNRQLYSHQQQDLVVFKTGSRTYGKTDHDQQQTLLL